LPANIDRQLANLERRMDKLEADEARSKASVMGRKRTNEEIIEISLNLLAYVFEGDTRRFADFFVSKGTDAGEASEIAALVGDLLEDRRRSAPDPRYPV